MKKALLFCMLAALSSCSTSYYQIYTAKPVNQAQESTVFETADCKITYDFWADGGDAGFTVLNKTSQPLTVLLDESFYIVNGHAFDYFQARTFTTSRTDPKALYASNYFYKLNLSQMAASTSGHSTSILERPSITIPPNASKSFSEYIINPTYFSHCDLIKYPSKRKIREKQFSASDSPFVFSNNITYSSGGKKSTVSLEFYVSAIKNLPESEEIKGVKVQG
ncbi:MAG: hypothetical protein EOP06_23830, partial [Proteobacteria bacterium]